jgi:hypothetical protein
MTYKEHVTSFIGKSGQFEYTQGRYEITYHTDIEPLFVTDDKCNITDSLNQSICDSVPGIKKSLDSNECRIIEVYDDFVIIELVKKNLPSRVSVPFPSLSISVMGIGGNTNVNIK